MLPIGVRTVYVLCLQTMRESSSLYQILIGKIRFFYNDRVDKLVQGTRHLMRTCMSWISKVNASL